MVVEDTEKEDDCTTQYETHLFKEAKETLEYIASLSQSPHLECPTLLDQSLKLLMEKITRPMLHILHSSDHCAPTSSQEDDTNNNDDDAATSSNSVHFVMIRYHLSAS
jgi:hypothetical protein